MGPRYPPPRARTHLLESFLELPRGHRTLACVPPVPCPRQPPQHCRPGASADSVAGSLGSLSPRQGQTCHRTAGCRGTLGSGLTMLSLNWKKQRLRGGQAWWDLNPGLPHCP